jgi:hypothetical protein
MTCRVLFMHVVRSAFCFALAKAGSSMAARMAIIAITTSSSIKVNARTGGRRSAPPSAVRLWIFWLFALLAVIF